MQHDEGVCWHDDLRQVEIHCTAICEEQGDLVDPCNKHCEDNRKKAVSTSLTESQKTAELMTEEPHQVHSSLL